MPRDTGHRWADPCTAPAGAVDLPDIFCGFVVHAEFPKNKEYSLIYSDAGGTVTHIRTTGALAMTLTNASNGNAHTFNISGPGNLVPHADGSTTLTATGQWILFFAPGQLGVGSPGAMVTFTGCTVLWTAANGFDQEIRSHTGTVSDVCWRSRPRRGGRRPQSLRARSEYISGRLPI